MSVEGRASALKNVWWTERDGIAIAKRSESDSSVDYISPQEVKTVTVHYNKLDQDFDASTTGTGVTLFSDYSPTPTGAWESGGKMSWDNISQTSSSGSGTGIKCDIAVSSAGKPTFTIVEKGSNYAVDDTIVFTDPGNTSYTATVTVSGLVASIGMADEPSIPEEFHEALANYAIAKGYELKPELIKMAGYFRSLFNDDVREGKKYANKGRDGTAYRIMGSEF